MPAPRDPKRRALWIERIRAAKTGVPRGPHTPASRRKISRSCKGLRRSKQGRANISKALRAYHAKRRDRLAKRRAYHAKQRAVTK